MSKRNNFFTNFDVVIENLYAEEIMIAIFKIIQVFFLASVKYVLTFPYALIIGLDFGQTLIAVTLGGIAGFFFFYYFSGFAILKYRHLKTFLWKHSSPKLRVKFRQLIAWRKRMTGERVFSKRNRFIVRFRSKFGLAGIVILSPVILSIPFGAFLLNKYYSKHKFAVSYMVLSILSWTVVFVAVALIFPDLVR